jgi:DNA sulfur modification protein DndB
MKKPVFKFPAIRGMQASKQYFVCMIPYNVLIKIFSIEKNYIDPKFRSQRQLNALRLPTIKKYILENKKSYVFSAIAASVDGEVNFNSIEGYDFGELIIDASSNFIINDGQHRFAAIQMSLEEDRSIENESIAVVLFIDSGLKRSQQIFSDLNKHAINTSKSINTLFDNRDNLAVFTNELVNNIEFLNKYVDKENDNLGKFSQKIFTLSNFYNANLRLLGNEEITNEKKDFVFKYWKAVFSNISEFNHLEKKEISKRALREEYIITQGVVLLALGKLGSYILRNKNEILDLKRLKNIDWSRNQKYWQNVVIRDGRIIRNEKSINQAFLKILEILKG